MINKSLTFFDKENELKKEETTLGNLDKSRAQLEIKNNVTMRPNSFVHHYDKPQLFNDNNVMKKSNSPKFVPIVLDAKDNKSP